MFLNFFGYFLVFRISTRYLGHRISLHITSSIIKVIDCDISLMSWERIDFYRVKTGKTLEQVSEALGVGKSMLMMVKTGKRRLSGKALYRLEQAEREAGILPKEPQIPARTTPTVRESKAYPDPGDGDVVAMLQEILRRLDRLEKRAKQGDAHV